MSEVERMEGPGRKKSCKAERKLNGNVVLS